MRLWKPWYLVKPPTRDETYGGPHLFNSLDTRNVFRRDIDAHDYSGRRGDLSLLTNSLIVGGLGKVYEGVSMLEAIRRFRKFVSQSKTEGARAAGEPVTLFKNYDVIRDYHPPDDE